VAVLTKDHAKWFALGWLTVIVLKYGVFGLTAWNNIFHPGLVPAPNQQPFLKPFLGLGQP
jgi:hypothetical protein